MTKIHRRQFICSGLKAAGAAVLLGTLSFGTHCFAADPDLIIDSFRPEPDELVRLLRIAAKNRADFADIFLEQTVSRQFNYVNGELLGSQFSIREGMAIRAITSKKTAFSATDTFDRKTAENAAKNVRDQLKSSSSKLNFNKLPQKPVMDYGIIKTRKKLERQSNSDVRKAIEKLYSQALVSSNLIKKAEISYTDRIRRILIANTHGNYIMDSQPSIDIVIRHTAERKNRQESASYFVSHRCGLDLLENPSLHETIFETSTEAIDNLAAKPVQSGRHTVLLRPRSASVITQQWMSFLHANQNQINLQIKYPKHLNLVDDGQIVNAAGSSHFDDEGSITSKTWIVKNGQHIRQLNQQSEAQIRSSALTGNARRSSFLNPPITAPTNTFIESTYSSPEIPVLSDGLIVHNMTALFDEHPGNIVHFLVTSGWWKQNGEIKHPVRNVLISARFPNILDHIEIIGNDLEFFSTLFNSTPIPISFGAPTIQLDQISVQQL